MYTNTCDSAKVNVYLNDEWFSLFNIWTKVW